MEKSSASLLVVGSMIREAHMHKRCCLLIKLEWLEAEKASWMHYAFGYLVKIDLICGWDIWDNHPCVWMYFTIQSYTM